MDGMKETGIRWIGAIPSAWRTKRIKYMATLKGRIGWQGLTSEEYQDEGAYLITGVDFQDGGINWEQCEHVPMKRWEEAREIQIENGDLLITKDGTIGKVAIVANMPGETSLNSGVLRILPFPGFHARFLYWVLQSDEFWAWFNFKNAGNSTIAHLYQGDFAEFQFAYPSETEQCLIANYLEKRSKQIDEIIAEIEKQISIIIEMKKALVSEVVTRGLHHNVKMKSSGTPWFGKIPEHWNISRLKYIMEKIVDCPHATPNYVTDGEYYVIRTADQDYASLRSDEYMYRLDAEEYRLRTKRLTVDQYDIVYGREGERWGFASLVPQSSKYCLGQRMMQFRCNPDVIEPRFAVYAISSSGVYQQGAMDCVGSTTPHVNVSTVFNYAITVPPIQEQAEIAEYLDRRCSCFDTVIVEKRKQIQKMQQHKQSLIFEYVTGKKRVKEVQQDAHQS